MRTTIDIDGDLLDAAKELARREGSTTGTVVSRLLRRALTGVSVEPTRKGRKSPSAAAAGFVPFPARHGVIVTQQQVDALRDAQGI